MLIILYFFLFISLLIASMHSHLISDSNSFCKMITSVSIDLMTPVSLSAITAIVLFLILKFRFVN